MKISIIGTGNVGGTLGTLWAKYGHEIIFGVRDVNNQKLLTLLNSIGQNVHAQSIPQAIASSSVVVIATPAAAVGEVIAAGGNWAGKIVIDTTNRLTATESIAQEIARSIPVAHVVKAFNTLGANNFAHPDFNGIPASMFICGDNPEAKEVVAGLTRQFGFDVVDVGDLSFAPLLESLAKLWIFMSRQYGRDFAFKILKR